MRKDEVEGLIHGIGVCRRAPKISHLLFADDSKLLFRATILECTYIRGLLSTYEAASGQAINFAKSGVFFNTNVPTDSRDELSNIQSIHEPFVNGKYLGLPSMFGRSKKSVFAYLIDKVW